jgi:hypothetical protein
MLSILLAACASPGFLPPLQDEARPVNVIFDMTAEDEVESWRPVHDTVMGGRGFASLRRSVPEEALVGGSALALRVRGDGSTYKIGLQTPAERFEVNWQAGFPTVADQWTTVLLPFEAFTPTWRGQLVKGARQLSLTQVRTLRLVIGEKQDGPFELDVAWVGSIGHEVERPAPGSIDASLTRGARLAERIAEGVEPTELAALLTADERLVVVSQPLKRGGLSIDATLLLGDLWAGWEDLARRDARVVQLIGDSVGWVAGRELGAESVRALREALELPADELRVVVTAGDGSVERSWRGPIPRADVVEALGDRRRTL